MITTCMHRYYNACNTFMCEVHCSAANSLSVFINLQAIYIFNIISPAFLKNRKCVFDIIILFHNILPPSCEPKEM